MLAAARRLRPAPLVDPRPPVDKKFHRRLSKVRGGAEKACRQVVTTSPRALPCRVSNLLVLGIFLLGGGGATTTKKALADEAAEVVAVWRSRVAADRELYDAAATLVWEWAQPVGWALEGLFHRAGRRAIRVNGELCGAVAILVWPPAPTITPTPGINIISKSSF